MKFKSIRISGFKSFLESTEIPIDNGLTGIVGPNGCGKSNIVEAMKWVMGENSARQQKKKLLPILTTLTKLKFQEKLNEKKVLYIELMVNRLDQETYN